MVVLADILGADEPATEEAARLVVELFADFLADPAPLLGRGFDRIGFEDFFDDGQMFGQSRGAFLRCTGRVLRGGLFGGSDGHRRCGQREQQLQLVRRKPFARSAEDASYEEVDLLPEQRVLPEGHLQLACEFGFARRHAGVRFL